MNPFTLAFLANIFQLTNKGNICLCYPSDQSGQHSSLPITTSISSTFTSHQICSTTSQSQYLPTILTISEASLQPIPTMFEKAQRDATKKGIKLKIKAQKCQKWLVEPNLKYRGTVCLPTIAYSKKLWQAIKSRAKKGHHELTELPPSLMTLPRELRQQILLGTYDLDNYELFEPLHRNRFHDFMALRAQHLGAWTLNLRKVHPDIDLDMDFVTKTWEAQLHKIQDELTTEFNWVWDHVLFESYAEMTPRQIIWCQEYRRMFMELGCMSEKLWWESYHPVKKYLRRIPGLRSRVGVDTRSKTAYKYIHGYLDIAWYIMNGTPDEYYSWTSDSSNF